MRRSWRAVRWVTGHELLRISRQKELLVFGLVLPVIIITLVGLTFGSTGAIELGVVDRDGTDRSRSLIARLDGEEGVTVTTYDDLRELRKDIRLVAVQAGLVVPAGYGSDLEAGAASVDVVLEPNAEGVGSALAALDSAVTQEGVEAGAAAFVAERLGGGGAERRARELVGASGDRLRPVAVEELDPDEAGDVGSFDYTAPANMVLFVFVNTFAVSTAIAIDRKEGRIRRLLGTPNPPGAVLAGIGLSRLLFSLVQSLVILGLGTLAFGVRWGDPVAAATLVLLWAVLSTAVGVLIGSLVADADQAQAIGIPVAIGCGMLGGCMWPLDIVPEAVRIAGHVTPHAWVMDAWDEVMFDEAGLAEVLPNLAVLVVGSAVLGLLAARALRLRAAT